MRQIEPPKETVNLPLGIRTVADQLNRPILEEFICTECDRRMRRGKNRVWYIVYTAAHQPDGYQIVRTQNAWTFAHTKNWALTIARRLESEGHTIIDIFPGTKTHISNKFKVFGGKS